MLLPRKVWWLNIVKTHPFPTQVWPGASDPKAIARKQSWSRAFLLWSRCCSYRVDSCYIYTNGTSPQLTCHTQIQQIIINKLNCCLQRSHSLCVVIGCKRILVIPIIQHSILPVLLSRRNLRSFIEPHMQIAGCAYLCGFTSCLFQPASRMQSLLQVFLTLGAMADCVNKVRPNAELWVNVLETGRRKQACLAVKLLVPCDPKLVDLE